MIAVASINKVEKLKRTSCSNLAPNSQQYKKNIISPLPMQYLGAKGRISEWIVNNIKKEIPSAKLFVDLFSGTGSVALEASSKGYQIVVNDIQPYSFALLSSIFKNNRDNIQKIVQDIEKLKNVQNLLSGKRNNLKSLLDLEDKYILSLRQGKLDWINYRKFCRETPRINPNKNIKSNNWNLFSTYYPNSYFGIRQCLEIDTLREYSESLNQSLKNDLLAAVISTLTFAVSSTTHLAQYLKPNSQKQSENILKRRSKSIIDMVIERLIALENFNIAQPTKVYNYDYLTALKELPSCNNTIVYADPPYFKEHYSRYYHVLDTFYLYDYPELTINKRTNTITEGLYRKNRLISEFGLKSKVGNAFLKMLNECAKKRFLVAISYANTSLINEQTMIKIINSSGYKIIDVKEKDLMHSAQGQASNKIAIEYLYILVLRDEK